jgi:hypothetical protein
MDGDVRHSPKARTASTSETIVERLPPVIPPTQGNRILILCFDGTGDQFDADNSNVVQLVSLLKKDDRDKQLVYYQVTFSEWPYSGIGSLLSL